MISQKLVQYLSNIVGDSNCIPPIVVTVVVVGPSETVMSRCTKCQEMRSLVDDDCCVTTLDLGLVLKYRVNSKYRSVINRSITHPRVWLAAPIGLFLVSITALQLLVTSTAHGGIRHVRIEVLTWSWWRRVLRGRGSRCIVGSSYSWGAGRGAGGRCSSRCGGSDT
jgi:hypothetical protein